MDQLGSPCVILTEEMVNDKICRISVNSEISNRQRQAELFVCSELIELIQRGKLLTINHLGEIRLWRD